MGFRTASMLICLFGASASLLPVCTPSQTVNGIPFTTQGIRSIQGKDVCSFQGEFPERFGVYLDHAKEYSVVYMQRDGAVAAFLLSKPTARCGLVDSYLDLTHLVRAGETVEFKCYTDHEGGTTPAKWGHVIGLANNHNGRDRFVHARLAWRVNIEGNRFEDLKGETVACDTSGYTD